MAAFNPTAWLEAFTNAGGTYAIGANDRLWLGTLGVVGNIEAHTADLIGHPERREAIVALIRERCLIA